MCLVSARQIPSAKAPTPCASGSTPTRCAAYSLVPSDVSGVLSAQNFEAAPGSLGESGDRTYEYSLRYKGRLKSIPEYENIIIKSDDAGNIIRLKDVAKIELGSLSYSRNSLSNGNPAVTGMVSQIAGSNANDIVTAIKAEIKGWRRTSLLA